MDINRKLVLGAVIIIAVAFIAINAEKLAPNDPYKVSLEYKLQRPCKDFPFGTDQMGRCILSRVLYGAQISLRTALKVMGITASLGIGLGVVSGFAGGIVDKGIMWLCEIVLAFPGLVLSLVIVGILGPGIGNLTIAMAATSWAKYTRVTKSLILEAKKTDYVKSAIISGCNRITIAYRHILPNILAPLVVMSVSSIGSIILSMAGLSFIGLGAQAPSAEWGMMVSKGKAYLESAGWMVFYPIIAIFVTVLGFNLFADGIRDKLDPHSY